MKNFIEKKYELHLILGIGIGFLLFISGVPVGMRQILPMFGGLFLGLVAEFIQYLILKLQGKSADYKYDKHDVLYVLYGSILATVICTLFPELESALFGVYLIVLSSTIWYLRFLQFRKLIVKYFALNYIGKKLTGLRAGTIILPLVIINGLITAFYDFNLIAFFPLAIALYFGFVYFIGNPVKWNELDKSQKFQYGSWEYSEMTLEEQLEWNQIYNELNKKQ